MMDFHIEANKVLLVFRAMVFHPLKNHSKLIQNHQFSQKNDDFTLEIIEWAFFIRVYICGFSSFLMNILEKGFNLDLLYKHLVNSEFAVV